MSIPVRHTPHGMSSHMQLLTRGRGVEAEDLGEVEMAEEEGEYGPSDLAVVLSLEDDTSPDVHVRINTDPATAPLLPMPFVVRPPPLWSCEQRQ